MTPSWYDVLGVEPDAEVAVIREAWKAGVADLEPGDRRFRLHNKAAEVLLDPERRAAHDLELEADQDPEPEEELVVDAPVMTGPGDLETPADLSREIASRTHDPGMSEASGDAPMTQESPAVGDTASTLLVDSSEVDLSRLRPGALELLVLADRIADRRGALAGAVDAVLAATVRPVLTGLDTEQLRSGAATDQYDP